MTNKNHVRIKGIDCYGEMYPEQNIEIICEDERYDGIYPDGFNTWTEAVDYLLEHHSKDIVELSAV